MKKEPDEFERYKKNREIVRRVLLQCEKTGKFTPSSRKFFEVGELELAAEGLVRFICGNSTFKESIEESDLDAVLALVGDPASLKTLQWD